MRALCDLGVGVENLEIGKIGAIFIQFLKKIKKRIFILFWGIHVLF